MKQNNYDVIIIGAGAVGCAVARELSRYALRIAVLEKNSDVAGETTGRNSAVVHAGFNNAPGSLMASLCVEGNEGFEALCRDLDVPYRETGKLLAAFDEEDVRTLEHLLAQGQANGCRDLAILEHEELGAFLGEHGMEETGSTWLKALWSPHTAITNPFLYCVALAENALTNGAEFFLNTKVTGIRREEASTAGAPGGNMMRFVIGTGGGEEFRCRYLINCAGLQADRIAAMAGVDSYRIYPCRGEYFILDKNPLPMPIYPAPRKQAGGLGVHLTPTSDGNIIIGPSAEYLDEAAVVPGHIDAVTSGAEHINTEDFGPENVSRGMSESDAGIDRREDYACTRPVMDELMRQAKQLMPAIAGMQTIGNYSGIRPKLSPPNQGGYHDFVIRAEESVPGLIDLVGIESPGLTASVPIARRVCRMIDDMEKEAGNHSGNSHADNISAGEPDNGARCSSEQGNGTRRSSETAHGLQLKPDFCGTRQGILRFREQSPARQAELIAADPDYGEIICRCQKITKREIREAIENPLGARSLSAIKYRAWATTGRCNGGYCLPRIASILVDEYGLSPEEVRYRDPGSEMFLGKVK